MLVLYQQNYKKFNLEICSQKRHWESCWNELCLLPLLPPAKSTLLGIDLNDVARLGHCILEKSNCLFFGPWQIPNCHFNIHDKTLVPIYTDRELNEFHHMVWKASYFICISQTSTSQHKLSLVAVKHKYQGFFYCNIIIILL